MPVEIALVDGTKLTPSDSNLTVDDILQRLSVQQGRAGMVPIDTEHGTYLVSPSHVVYVRTVEERKRAAGFA